MSALYVNHVDRPYYTSDGKPCFDRDMMNEKKQNRKQT